jgi:hypothetical protein
MLEMMANGSSLKDILNDLCCSIDVEASPVISTVLLIDRFNIQVEDLSGCLRVAHRQSEYQSAILTFRYAESAPIWR